MDEEWEGRMTVRFAACAGCEYQRSTGAWRSSRCCFRDLTGLTNFHEIDRPFLDGPDTNCPADNWHGLTPDGSADPEEYAEAAEQKAKDAMLERQRRWLKPVLLATIGRLPEEARLPALDEWVEVGLLAPEIATEIADELQQSTTETVS